MTKLEFNNFDKSQTVYCEACKKSKKVEYFSYSLIRYKDRTSLRCRVCDWIKRNNSLVASSGLSIETIRIVVSFFLENKNKHIHILSELIGESIEQTYNIVRILHLDNQHLLITRKCQYCGKTFDDTYNHRAKNENYYCSVDCYANDKKNTFVGEKNPLYKKIHTNCTNCGKDVSIIPYKNNLLNSFGENHNFCSQKCYWEYRSLYYIKDKAPRYGQEVPKEERNKMRACLLKRLNSDDRLNTSIQIKVNSFLDKLNIIYKRENVFDYYSVDNYLVDYNLIIEVMGDYWHTSPFKYGIDGYMINDIQRKQINRDKIKKSYIANKYCIDILYLWETDINKFPEKCIKLIDLYVRQNGILKNYHSFNYTLENGKIILLDNIVKPYQDQSINEYRHLILHNNYNIIGSLTTAGSAQ